MQCVRCQHELPPRADRCVRCFALNPRNASTLPWTGIPRHPPRPVPVSFDDARELRTEPPEPEGRFILREARRAAPRSARLMNESQLEITLPLNPPPAPPAILNTDAPRHRDPPSLSAAPSLSPSTTPKPSGGLRAVAFGIDAVILAATLAAFILLSTAVIGADTLAPHGIGSRDYWLDLLVSPRLPVLWSALGAALALAYSAFFAILGGRTPGLALTGLRLLGDDGCPLTPAQALTRAAWALPSAALGLFGFALALFDRRGQALHDKITRSVVVPDVC